MIASGHALLKQAGGGEIEVELTYEYGGASDMREHLERHAC